MNNNLSNFSYDYTDLNHYFTDDFDCFFNEKIIESYSKLRVRINGLDKILVSAEERLEGEIVPLYMSPISFLNLLYHEFDYILGKDFQQLQYKDRLNAIPVNSLDRLMFLQKLIDLLTRQPISNRIKYVLSSLKSEYEKYFNKFFSDQHEEAVKYYNEICESINKAIDGISLFKDRLHFLLTLEEDFESLTEIPEVNLKVFSEFITPNIIRYRNYLKDGIDKENDEIIDEILSALNGNKNEPKSKMPKPFHEFLMHKMPKEFSKEIYLNFESGAKGKRIRYMIEALKVFNPPLIAIDTNSHLLDSLIVFFNDHSMNYNTIFNCPYGYDIEKDKKGVDDAKKKIEIILDKLNTKLE